MGTSLSTHDTDEPVDYKRDRWGRAIINGKPYTRSSAAAKVLEDTYNLEMWQRRNVAYGLAKDASLVARILALGGDPTTWGKTERQTVEAVIEDANKIAQSHKRADIGTALHRMMEHVDAGVEVDAGPYQADIDAYLGARDALGLMALPEYLECKMVCHALELAGSVDNIYAHNGTHVIGDKKTGRSVEYAILGYAAQLAAYAHGEIWDAVADEAMPTPVIDTDTGYIVHVPAGEGRCDIYAVDLREGYRAAELAVRVRTIRKESKAWAVKIAPSVIPSVAEVEQTPEPGTARPGSGEIDEALELANSIADWGGPLKALLAAEWPVDVPTPGKVRKGEATWDAEQLARVKIAVDEIVGPFDDPPTERRPLRSSTPQPVEADHDGPVVADEVLEGLLTTIKASPVRSIVNGWLSEAAAAGRSWQPRTSRRLRQVEIARAAYWLASIIADAPDDVTDGTYNDLVRSILADAMGHDDALMPAIPIGEALSALTIGEAHAVSEAAQSLLDGHLFVTFTDTGRPVLTPAA